MANQRYEPCWYSGNKVPNCPGTHQPERPAFLPAGRWPHCSLPYAQVFLSDPSPDTSMLMSLSEALEITVNELLSAEKISPENYSMKAEETIMTLMKENEAGKRTHLISQIIGLLLIILAFVLIFAISAGTETIALFLDSASFVFLLIISVGVVLLSGARDRESVLMLLSKTVIPIGIVIAIVSFIIFMALINDLSVIGPNLCVIMLSILYSCIAKIIIEIMISKRRQ